MQECRRLKFKEKPNYNYLIDLFNTCLKDLEKKEDTKEDQTQDNSLDDIVNPEFTKGPIFNLRVEKK